MQKPVYINSEHEIILSSYIHTVIESVRDISTEIKTKNFIDVLDIIIDYHNNYNRYTYKGYYVDFMNIIPTNLTSCVNGFIAGVETNRNRSKCRAYKVLLNELAHKVVDDLKRIKSINE